jgi:hypothetical protein
MHYFFIPASGQSFSVGHRRPIMSVIPEPFLEKLICKIHDKIRVDLTSLLWVVWQLHLPKPCTKEIGEISTQDYHTTSVIRYSGTLRNGNWRVAFDFESHQNYPRPAAVGKTSGAWLWHRASLETVQGRSFCSTNKPQPVL